MPCTMIFVPLAADAPAAARAAVARRFADAPVGARLETSPDRAPRNEGDAIAGASEPPGIAAWRADATRRVEGAGARCGREACAATDGDAETAKSDIMSGFPGKILYVIRSG